MAREMRGDRDEKEKKKMDFKILTCQMATGGVVAGIKKQIIFQLFFI